MKPDSYFLPYAEAAFNAFNEDMHRVDSYWHITPWERAGATKQAHWIAAVKAVFHLLDVVDADTGESFA